MTDDQKQPDDKFASAREPSPTEDVVAPTSDEALNDALEDTFPASDPINFAGSSAGRSPENAEKEPAATPPVGTHPLAGTPDHDIDDAAADVGGDAENDPARRP
jgi:hypothetical protein